MKYIDFLFAHWAIAASVLTVLLANFITAATAHPDVVPDSALKYVKFAAQFVSLLTHSGSDATFKVPFSLQASPGGLTFRGFARLSTLCALAAAGLLVSAAHAQTAPAPSPAPVAAPVAAPADPAPVAPRIGGCFASGKWCVGPTVALTLTAVNLTSKHIEAGFAPGVGVGFTYLPGTWSSIGLGAYFALVPGSQGIPDNASGAIIASFLNGWGRVGVSKGFLGDTSTRLLVGTGIDL